MGFFRNYLPFRWRKISGFLTVSIKTSGLAGGFDDSVQKASQSLPPAGGKSSEIIFARGVYLGENTSQSASVEFVRFQRTNYARSRLQAFIPKGLALWG
ncbi:MAG: hypothetical protein ACLR5H_02995 [Oscillospiraceae bacterium]